MNLGVKWERKFQFKDRNFGNRCLGKSVLQFKALRPDLGILCSDYFWSSAPKGGLP